jgi:hypothetical protein
MSSSPSISPRSSRSITNSTVGTNAVHKARVNVINHLLQVHNVPSPALPILPPLFLFLLLLHCTYFLFKVAKTLQKMNNLNGMCAVIGGLNNSSVTRLKKTFQVRKIIIILSPSPSLSFSSFPFFSFSSFCIYVIFQRLAKYPEIQSVHEELTLIAQGTDNHRKLRELWSAIEPPAIPYLGKKLEKRKRRTEEKGKERC